MRAQIFGSDSIPYPPHHSTFNDVGGGGGGGFDMTVFPCVDLKGQSSRAQIYS
jgi:hypothetical protein